MLERETQEALLGTATYDVRTWRGINKKQKRVWISRIHVTVTRRAKGNINIPTFCGHHVGWVPLRWNSPGWEIVLSAPREITECSRLWRASGRARAIVRPSWGANHDSAKKNVERWDDRNVSLFPLFASDDFEVVTYGSDIVRKGCVIPDIWPISAISYRAFWKLPQPIW